MSQTEQAIVDHLYAEVESANDRLALIDAPWRFVKSLDTRQVDPRREVPPPDPTEPSAMIPGDAISCQECGHLLPAGGCQPCAECGTTSGGCG